MGNNLRFLLYSLTHTTHAGIAIDNACTRLDVTVFKGPQFILISKLDNKQYTKPFSASLHFPRQSHHPDSTFQSILSGTVRSAVASCSFACSFANHQLQLEMNAKRGQYVYRVRGYSNISLTSSLGLRQTFKMQKEEYNNLRKKYLWMSRFKLMHN